MVKRVFARTEVRHCFEPGGEDQLSGRQWLAADHPTIADIAMYSYVRVADEGELDISPYPAILRWLGDVEALLGFEPMPRFPQEAL